MEIDGRERTLLLGPGAFLAEGLVVRDAEGRALDSDSLRGYEGRLADDPRSAARLVGWKGEVQGVLLVEGGFRWLIPAGPGRLASVAAVDLPGDTEDYLPDGLPDCEGVAEDPAQSSTCLGLDLPLPSCDGALADLAHPDLACLPGDTEGYLDGIPRVPDPLACLAILDNPLKLDPDCLAPLRDDLRPYDPLAGAIYDEEPECQGFLSGTLADPAGLATGWSRRTFEVAVAVDAQAATMGSPNWPARIALVVASVDALYGRDLQLGVRIVDMHTHDASVFTNTTPGGGLDELIAHYGAAHQDIRRENVHLFTGRDIDGAVAGVANCIGGAGNESLAYTWGEYHRVPPGWPFWVTSWDILVAAHEMGHILRAEHHLANCAESTKAFGVVERCTLMFPVADPDTDKLSAANRLAVRGYVDTHGI